MKNNEKTKRKICVSCLILPILNKKRGLCKKCYGKFYYQMHKKPSKTKEQKRAIFINRLYKKYGKKIIIDFKLLRNKPFWNLTDIAKKYNFSTENARLIYNKLFHEPYNIKRNKKTKIINKKIGCTNDPRYKVAEYKPGKIKTGAIAELLFFKKCIDLKFNTQILCKNLIDIKVNNYLVEIKSTNNATKTSKSAKCFYFVFTLSEKQRKTANFIACYIHPQKQFYIIPNKLLKGNMIYIPSDHSRKNKYSKYKNAWQLLAIEK